MRIIMSEEKVKKMTNENFTYYIYKLLVENIEHFIIFY